jgi:uncharacterized protein with FMN-binding domain
MDSKKKLALVSVAAVLPLIGAGCATDTTGSVTTSAPHETTNPNAGDNGMTQTEIDAMNSGENDGTASGDVAVDTGTNDTAATASEYKDGTYTATGKYVSPGGNQQITVALTVKDGVVTDSSVTEGSVDPTSKQFQAMVIANYKTLVIGKKLSEINLTKISGSSLTPKGFMDAVAQIKVKAQA